MIMERIKPSSAALAGKLDVDLALELEGLGAGERLRLLHARHGARMVATTSFGVQAAVMLHLIKEHAPDIPVVFIDSGYLFGETYRYAEELTGLLDLDVRVYQPAITAARMEALHGKLWEQGGEGMDRYGMLTKLEPMNRALSELGRDIWLSGMRRVQSRTRLERPFAEQQKRTLKVYPILDWADAQVEAYFHEHDLPRHPLAAQGYVTMGDWHSTQPASAGLDAEATRFKGEKYECGLHFDSGQQDFQI